EYLVSMAAWSSEGHDRARHIRQPRIFRRAGPGKSQRDARAWIKVEQRCSPGELRLDPIDVNHVGQIETQMNDRNIPYRQYSRIGQVDGLAAHLHSKLRSADHGRSNALPRLNDRD